MAKKDIDHLNNIIEWQTHQYDPGHYTGGKLTPFEEARGNQLKMAIWMFVQAGVVIVLYCIMLYCLVHKSLYFSFGRELSTPESIALLSGTLGVLAFLYVLSGIRYYRKHMKKKLSRKRYIHKKRRR